MLTAALLALSLSAPAAAETPDALRLSPVYAAPSFQPASLGSYSPSAALMDGSVSTSAVDAPRSSGKMKRPMLAAGLNFFLPGAGYLYNGEKPLYVSVPMMAGAVGLTYIEQFHQFENGTLREQDSRAFGVMFGAVFVLNTGAAIDAFREARAINARNAGPQELSVTLSPAAFQGAEQTSYGLTLDARF